MKSEYYKVTPIDPENLPDGEVMCWNENSFQTAYGEIHLSELEDSELVFCQNVCVTHYLQPVEPQAIDVLDELRHYCKEGRDYKMGIDTDFEQGQVLALKVVIEKIDELRNACAMTEGKVPTDEEIEKEAISMGGGNFFKNHFPKDYGERVRFFKSGALWLKNKVKGK